MDFKWRESLPIISYNNTSSIQMFNRRRDHYGVIGSYLRFNPISYQPQAVADCNMRACVYACVRKILHYYQVLLGLRNATPIGSGLMGT